MKKVEAAALIVGAGLLVMSWTMSGTAIEITRPEIEVTAATEIPAYFGERSTGVLVVLRCRE